MDESNLPRTLSYIFLTSAPTLELKKDVILFSQHLFHYHFCQPTVNPAQDSPIVQFVKETRRIA
jgi:hypothetical protein